MNAIKVTAACGTRGRYVAGCRCVPCRAANSRYACERQRAVDRGERNNIVSADGVRSHVRELSRRGVGYKSVADAASFSRSCLLKIMADPKRGIRAQAARRILAVDVGARAGGAVVSARATWRRIEALLDEGFTRGRIALELGCKTRALQIRRRTITARTAANVERLYRRYMEVPDE